MVLAAIRECLDDMHSSSFNLAEFFNEISEALIHKVKQVRCETLKWIRACIAKTNGATISDIKPFSTLFVKVIYSKPTPPNILVLSLMRSVMQCLDDSQANVRDTAYAVLAILVAQRGDAYMQSLVEEFDLDRFRLSKLKEFIQSSDLTEFAAVPLSSSPTAGGRPRSNSGSRRTSGPPAQQNHAVLTQSQTDPSHSPHSVLSHSSPALPTGPYVTPSKTTLKELFNQATRDPQPLSFTPPDTPLSVQPNAPIPTTPITVHDPQVLDSPHYTGTPKQTHTPVPLSSENVAKITEGNSTILIKWRVHFFII